ncbi:serine palmitoyltransferase small subunit B [Manduca sexta]|uniref:serine palmitoyltransferase small subunit B n=1 Tax=Manduca sexta TaxID=7130 RepID=UPI0018908631|nr:serine palmitoyltransferase small subunit B [Manduca sexta]
MDMIKKIQQYIKYMYIRYLLVTELYMVETWEQILIHLLFLVLFIGFWYFNYSILMSGIGPLKLQTLGDMGIQAA